MNDTATIAEAAERYLRRLFPKRHVRTQSVDYGHLVEVGFLVEDDIGASRWLGIRTHKAHADTEQGRRALAAKLLRTAYPRGWAVP